MKKIFKSPIFIVILAAVITVVAAFLIKGAVEKAKSEPTPQNVVSWTIDNIENAPSYVASYEIDLENRYTCPNCGSTNIKSTAYVS